MATAASISRSAARTIRSSGGRKTSTWAFGGDPSQKQAVEYVARVARQYGDKTIRIGGHSKGGNLAVYSAAKSSGEIQERIVAVHNNDGPGFAWDISETPGHKRIASRIHTILPQTSVVGMLMEHEKRYQVVHSTYDGLYQHDGFSWQVLGTQFVHLDDFSREGKLVDETLSSWADSLNTQQREALADALYSVFTASGAKTLSELTEEKLKSAAAMLKTYKNLDRETRRMVTEAFMLFFKLGTKNFVLDTQEEGSREIENIRKRSQNNTRNWWSARSKYSIPAARGACSPALRRERDKGVILFRKREWPLWNPKRKALHWQIGA